MSNGERIQGEKEEFKFVLVELAELKWEYVGSPTLIKRILRKVDICRLDISTFLKYQGISVFFSKKKKH